MNVTINVIQSWSL